MSFNRDALAAQLANLSRQKIFIGTSSWKYPGWRGQLYDEARYVYRGRFSNARFERLCVAEYAEVFPTVSVDAAYYQFPNERQLGELVAQVPASFQFALKVTDEITIKRFPRLPRHGTRAGEVNRNFLNADLFASAFLKPCSAFQSQIGLVMFEFSRFHGSEFERGREFVEALDQFLARLPKGWRYGVEIRNAGFLQPEYFATLARHGVTHIFSSWEAMPSVADQLALAGSVTSPDFMAGRFLLRPGRKYEEAVKAFSPYSKIQDAYPEGRSAAVRMIRDALARQSAVFLFVNNRFEGNAIDTIAAVLAETESNSG